MPDLTADAPHTWETRPFRASDRPAIEAFLRTSFEQGDLPGRQWYDIVRSLDAMPGSPEDTIVGTMSGTIVGYVTPHQQELVVHPDFRRQGVGTRLVEAGLAHARRDVQPALTLAPPPGNAGAEAFATRLGFTYDSSLWQLRLPPGRAVDRPAFPPSVIARPFTPDVDIGRYVGMINSAFVDHASPIVVTIDAVAAAHSRPEFAPDNICLLSAATDPDTPIGFCRTRVDIDDDGRRVGEVSLIGILAPWRGQGLGRELLKWGVHHLRELDVDELTLHVEAKNDRALGLYERTGFVRSQEWPRWSRPVPPTG